MATIIKGLIGEEDINLKSSGTSLQTFTREDSSSRIITLSQFDAAHLQFRSIAKQVDDLVDGGYDVDLKTGNIITKAPWIDARAFGARPSASASVNRAAIQAAMEVAALGKGRVLLSEIGEYEIDEKLVYKASLHGISRTGTIIKAASGFSDTMMLDMYHGDTPNNYNGMSIKNIRWDANFQAGVNCFNHTVVGGGGASGINVFENLEFYNVRGAHAVYAHNAAGNQSVLTGCTFINCAWWYCDAWVYFGNVQDDILLINSRFNHVQNQDFNGYPIFVAGENVLFDGAFIFFQNLSALTTVKAVVNVNNAYNTNFRNIFFETTGGSDVETLFYVNGGYQKLSINGMQFNLDSVASFNAIAMYAIGQNDSRYHNLDIHNVHDIDGTLRKAVDVQVLNTAVDDYLTVNISGCGNSVDTPMFQWNAGATTKARETVRIFGEHHGVAYAHGFRQAVGNSTPYTQYGFNNQKGLVSEQEKNEEVSATNSQTSTYTLSGEGQWLVSIAVTFAGTFDNMASGLWLVHYKNNVTNDLLISTEIDEQHNGAVSNLTLGNPNAAGEVIATFTYTGTNTSQFYIKAKRLHNFLEHED